MVLKKLDTVTVFGTLCEQMYIQVRMVRHKLWLRSMQVIDYIGLCEAVRSATVTKTHIRGEMVLQYILLF